MKQQLSKKLAAFIISVMMFSVSVFAQWDNITLPPHIFNTNIGGRVGIGTGSTLIPSGILTVKGPGSLPSPAWVPSGIPIFTGYGENVVGNADYILAMASDIVGARPVFMGRRSRGTLSLPTAVIKNDLLSSYLVSGYDGSAFQNPASIDFYADGIPSAGHVPSRISFVTGTNSTDRKERLKIESTGDVTVNNNQLVVKQSGGNIGIGTTAPNNSAIVEMNSTTQGILIPRMNLTQRNLVAGVDGLLIYQTDNGKGFYYFDGTSRTWKSLINSSTNPWNDYAFMIDKKPSSEYGGNPGGIPNWIDRTINSVLSGAGSSVSLYSGTANNTGISLASGTYYIRASAPLYSGSSTGDARTKLVVKDFSTNEILLEGTSEFANHNSFVQIRSFVEGTITIPTPSGASVIKLSQWVTEIANSTNKPTLGVATTIPSVNEVYSQIFIQRIQ